ncbi:hypothetical protein CcI6DRAFT_01940 [Frankia sp. CcI6]|uniref:hypothetical protein n=1 Tax=Frankia TaxID=1854 RepID=UPI0003CFF63A|nr:MULTISPECIES: hypothetical protein [Frankia]ETA02553.1 hypothetical protein CcI6DRAFT_01940 [Frankia sp. CcI6]OAA30655.1 hypothetical protein AAY23_100620 [Frankia casuarinae]
MRIVLPPAAGWSRAEDRWCPMAKAGNHLINIDDLDASLTMLGGVEAYGTALVTAAGPRGTPSRAFGGCAPRPGGVTAAAVTFLENARHRTLSATSRPGGPGGPGETT